MPPGPQVSYVISYNNMIALCLTHHDAVSAELICRNCRVGFLVCLLHSAANLRRAKFIAEAWDCSWPDGSPSMEYMELLLGS